MNIVVLITVIVAAASSITDVVLFAIGLRGKELSSHSRKQRILLGIGVFMASMVLGVVTYRAQFPSVPAEASGLPLKENATLAPGPPEPKARNTQTVRSSPVTFQGLMEYVYEEVHTAIQRDDFLKRHLGRRVTWDGWVGGVSDHGKEGISVLVTPDKDSVHYFAFLIFPQEDREELASLSFGQKLRATCTFVNFDARAHLTDCELLRVWTVAEALDNPQG